MCIHIVVEVEYIDRLIRRKVYVKVRDHYQCFQGKQELFLCEEDMTHVGKSLRSASLRRVARRQ